MRLSYGRSKDSLARVAARDSASRLLRPAQAGSGPIRVLPVLCMHGSCAIKLPKRFALSVPRSSEYIEGTSCEAVMRNRILGAGLAVITLTVLLQAQQLALFLTDGTRLNVREYEVMDQLVRYFSAERGQWEEVPRDIVDLDRTRQHNQRQKEAARAREEEERRERIAERRARTELHRVPLDDGVYYVRGDERQPLEQATFMVGTSKKRTVLNVIAPVPVMPGKQTIAVEGLSAKMVTTDEKPVFYLRLDRFSRFGISRAKTEKGRNRRVVQYIYTVPRAEEEFEAQEAVEVFRQQLAPLVYKIWPTDPLAAGEYAVIEYTPGESNLRAWDFSHRPAAAP